MIKEQAEREAARERVIMRTRPLSVALNAIGLAGLVLMGAIRRGWLGLPQGTAFLPLGAVILIYGAIDLRTGVANAFSRGRAVLRSQEPGLFWFLVSAKFILAASSVWFACRPW